MQPRVVRVAGPRDVAVRPDQHRRRCAHPPEHRKFPIRNTFRVNDAHAIGPAGDAAAPGAGEIEQHRPGVSQQGEHPRCAVGGDQVEIGHAPAQQRMPRAQVVANVQAGYHRGEPFPRFVHAQQLGDEVAQRPGALVGTQQRHLRYRVAQHALADRMPFGVVGVQQGGWRRAADHQGQLPAQIHRILHAGVQSLPAHRVMDVCGVPGQQHPPVTVARRLACRIGEPGNPTGTVDSVIRAVDRDQRLPQVVQVRLGRAAQLPLGDQHPHTPGRLRLGQGMHAERIVVNPPLRWLPCPPIHFGLGEQIARRRLPAREVDTGRFADHAAAPVAADQILPAQGSAVGRDDVHAGVVLGAGRYPVAAVNWHTEFADPVGQDALDVVLPQRQSVGVPGGKVADVQPDLGEAGDLRHLPLGQETIHDPALVEDFERAGMQTAGARADQLLVGPPLDHRDVDSGQPQLAGQHQPRRAGSGDEHRMVADRPLRETHTPHFAPHSELWFETAVLRHRPGLAASPGVRYRLRVGGKATR